MICLDNFFTGSRENIAHLIGLPNFELIRHDVIEPLLVEVDQIYHLACPASPVHYKCVCCSSFGVLRSTGCCAHSGALLPPHECCFARTQAPAAPRYAARRWDPIKTAKTSFLGTLNMLGLATRCKVRTTLPLHLPPGAHRGTPPVERACGHR